MTYHSRDTRTKPARITDTNVSTYLRSLSIEQIKERIKHLEAHPLEHGHDELMVELRRAEMRLVEPDLRMNRRAA